MIISCITTASNKAVLIKGIPFRIVQIKGFVVNTETTLCLLPLEGVINKVA